MGNGRSNTNVRRTVHFVGKNRGESELSPISRSSFLVQEPDITQKKIPLGKRYQLQTQMAQHFWKRWVRKCVTALQQRNKCHLPQKSLGIGELVIVMDENTSPGHWLKARVQAVYPGNDEHVRAATIKTANSELQRPVVKLINLPVLD